LASVGPGLLRATPVERTCVETAVRGSYRGEFRLHFGVDTHQNCHYGDRKHQADQTRYKLVLHRPTPHTPECPKLMGSIIMASSRKQKGHIVVRRPRDLTSVPCEGCRKPLVSLAISPSAMMSANEPGVRHSAPSARRRRLCGAAPIRRRSFVSELNPARRLFPYRRPPLPTESIVSIFCHDWRPKCADQGTGDGGMGSVEVLRNKAEECLEKACEISNRQRVRLLLVQAHNHLKCAEETEAQQLSARR
jgi:hypothetical protein